MKTVAAMLDVQVPVAMCCKCDREAPCRAVLRHSREGMLMVMHEIPFTPIHLGQAAGLLCDECKRFVEGAFLAMGLKMETPQPPPGRPTSS